MVQQGSFFAPASPGVVRISWSFGGCNKIQYPCCSSLEPGFQANSVGLPPELKQKGVDFQTFKNLLDNINTNHFNRLGCWVHLPFIGSIMAAVGTLACFGMGAAGHDAFIVAIVGFASVIGGVIMGMVGGCKMRSVFIQWMREMNLSYFDKINEEPYWKSKGITFRLTEQQLSGYNNRNAMATHYFLDIMYGVSVTLAQPVVVTQPQTAAPAFHATPVSLPAWWVQRTDPSTGKVYYANTSKQVTQWTPPTAEQIAAEQKEMNAAAAPAAGFNAAV